MNRKPSTEVKNAVRERAKGCCEYCGGKSLGGKGYLEYEHIKPWHLSKDSSYGNIALVCLECNQVYKRVYPATTFYHAKLYVQYQIFLSGRVLSKTNTLPILWDAIYSAAKLAKVLHYGTSRHLPSSNPFAEIEQILALGRATQMPRTVVHQVYLIEERLKAC